MTNRETMELFIEKNGQETVAYPFVEKDHVVFGNGMGIEEVIEQDISMPTVTHEEVSFKVGVGDQDVSSSVVDSSVGEMVIKGQTYHNILPEPSTHVLTNNKEMFKVNEGLDPNVEIVDGVAKSAILTGQTLVNNVQRITTTSSYTTIHNNEIGFTIDTNGETTTSRRSFTLLCTNKITPGAKYTVIVDVAENTITRENDSQQVLKIVLNNYNNIDSGYVQIKIGETGLRVFEIIASSVVTSDNPYVETPRDINGRLIVNGISIIEGHNHNLTGFIEGMQSVKMPVLTTTGKNLFDGELVQGYLGSSSGILNNDNRSVSSANFIKVNGDEKISISQTGFTGDILLFNYDENKNFLGTSANHGQIMAGSKFIKFRIYSATIENLITNQFSIQVEKGSLSTTYEPFKSNILTVNEDVELRGIGDVKDELNVATGELTQRIGEIVLDGTQKMNFDSNGVYIQVNEFKRFTNYTGKMTCDKLPVLPTYGHLAGVKNGISAYTNASDKYVGQNWIYVRVNNSINKDEVKEWLTQNPTTVQYYLTEESVKTVDLSTSGNWEKIVFNGSENWSVYPRSSSVNFVNTIAFQTNTIPNAISTENYQLFSESFRTTSHYASDVEGIFMKGTMRLSIKKSKLMSQDVDGLKQYLQQNPLTVWYQTVVHQDSTQVKQPIFFKDGHIQLSSGADNSLIPTLNYQAKTSNSYVMDLMKANTRYTMKAKTASGTFTIDGTSYGAGTNGTFTTPSSMTNKLLVMSNKTNEEVMILEGDVTDKTIPYFKGIKSAFEGEDKIEVLSTGKNLFDGAFEKGMIDVNGNLGYTPTAIRTVNYISVKPNASYHINLLNLEPFESARVVYVHEYDENFKVLGETQVDNRDIYISKSATKFIKINTHNAKDLPVDSKMIVCENPTLDKQYEPYKSNNTKIPLLSPLRSLPNGVCDELIIDRMKKKATLIQRSESVIFNGSENWNLNEFSHDKLIEFVHYSSTQIAHTIFSDRFVTGGENVERVAFSGGSIYVRISKTKVGDVNSFKQWLSQNPLTVQYGLDTPVVTEVDLEGFPYIYKDGHIFLNSEIAPTTQTIYSISQQHQISASTQDLIRHEQELVYLYKLIAQYIQVDYQSTLLSLDLKLK